MKLLDYANEYVRQSDWKTMALLKLCLCAVGVAIGLAVPVKHKRCALVTAAVVFLATYPPLIWKFISLFRRRSRYI